MDTHITIPIAFIAGLVSFLAPCVLPIIPGFLAYLSGSSMNGSQTSRREVVLNALFFVIGFSIVFALLGVLLNTVLDSVAYDARTWLSRIGGGMIIFFGLYLTGLVRVGFLEREYKMRVMGTGRSRYFTSFLFGLAFAAGWTPCVGAALGAILGLAAAHPGTAFYLLLAYALGLGVPFLLVGFFVSQAASAINRFAYIIYYINIIFGIILIVLGILVFTENLSAVANFSFLNNYLIAQ